MNKLSRIFLLTLILTSCLPLTLVCAEENVQDDPKAAEITKTFTTYLNFVTGYTPFGSSKSFEILLKKSDWFCYTAFSYLKTNEVVGGGGVSGTGNYKDINDSSEIMIGFKKIWGEEDILNLSIGIGWSFSSVTSKSQWDYGYSTGLETTKNNNPWLSGGIFLSPDENISLGAELVFEALPRLNLIVGAHF